MSQKDIDVFYPENAGQWRQWLEKYHQSKDAVWLEMYSKRSGKKSVTWSDAVDEALCFGWIDSKKIKIDEERSRQYFSKRKAKSTWSKINKIKIESLMEKGLMAEAGLLCIEIAKENGSWTLLDEVEERIIPSDLQLALNQYPKAIDYFTSQSPSVQKLLLSWVVLARTPETRGIRIQEIADSASQGRKPRNFQFTKV